MCSLETEVRGLSMRKWYVREVGDSAIAKRGFCTCEHKSNGVLCCAEHETVSAGLQYIDTIRTYCSATSHAYTNT